MGHSQAFWYRSLTPESARAHDGWQTRRANMAAAAKAQAETAKRMELADKIVLALVDQISAAIIRPGPKAEERECYVMAQELRDHSAELRDLVADILAVEQSEVQS